MSSNSKGSGGDGVVPSDGNTSQPLSVEELETKLASIAAVYRKVHVDTEDWKRRYQLEGFEGVSTFASGQKSRPNATSAATVKRVLELSFERPALGCNRLESVLAGEGHHVSAVTIQKILNNAGLGKSRDRWLALSAAYEVGSITMTGEQIAFVEAMNPCFRERHHEAGQPGELMVAGTQLIARSANNDKQYLHFVVDTFGGYAFGILHKTKKSAAAVAVLHNEVLPFYMKMGIVVKTIRTENSREFCGREEHPYELYLKLNDIEHQVHKAIDGRANGFATRFRNIVLAEFVGNKKGVEQALPADALACEFSRWLAHYNTQRPFLGYRNYGRTPAEMIDAES